MLRRSILGLTLCAAALAACGGDEGGGELTGSYLENHPMQFEDVVIKLQSGVYVISYQRPQGSGLEQTLRLIWDAPDDLSGIQLGQSFVVTNSVTVDRILGSGNTSLNDGITEIRLSFDELGSTEGATVKGSFGIQFATGHNLGGNFNAPLQIVTAPTTGD